MIRKNSICGLVSALVSTVLFGCMSFDSNESVPEADVRLESQAAADEPGYGYEMIPLQLKTNATAPATDSPMPNGRVAPEEVVRQATDRIGALRTCYANALTVNPALSGEVRALHKFAPNGELTSLRIESDLALTPEFKNCLTSALNTMRMPATSTGTLHVDYPITLDPAVMSAQP